MQLRPYQEEAKNAILAQWVAVDKTLLVLPTGTGKTIVFCKLAEALVSQGKRVLILAHRGELLDQAADKMQTATGLGCSVEKADQSCLSEWFRITVGSVQTLMRPARLALFKRDHFDVIIVDEAHHVMAESYMRILDYFEDAKVLGVTATPDRSDMRQLGDFFESLAYDYSLPKAIKEGYLSPIKALTLPLNIDLTSVSMQAGDFKAADLGTALEPYLDAIADEMVEHCKDRKTVIFLPLIATSQKMCEILKSKGFRAAEVNGESKDRKEVLADFNDGRYNVLCNSMLLTEGWDCPTVDCIICLRPTKIPSLYAQIVGRGTRLSPGKEYLLLLDFLWHSERHELCRPAHLIATDDDVRQKMIKTAEEEAGELMDLEEAEQNAEGDCIADREEALAKKLQEMRKRKRKLVDPLQYEMSICAEDLASYKPAFGWEMEPPTQRQQERLEKAGILTDDIHNAGKAKLLLERIDKRRTSGLTTPKQIRLLERYGFKQVGQWEFEGARKMIDRIAGNHWRTPRDVQPSTFKPVGGDYGTTNA
jgi:superfamily II DNA or RNA helicase